MGNGYKQWGGISRHELWTRFAVHNVQEEIQKKQKKSKKNQEEIHKKLITRSLRNEKWVQAVGALADMNCELDLQSWTNWCSARGRKLIKPNCVSPSKVIHYNAHWCTLQLEFFLGTNILHLKFLFIRTIKLPGQSVCSYDMKNAKDGVKWSLPDA